MLSQAKELKDFWQPPEVRRGEKRFFSGDFSGNMALLTPWFWTIGHQNLREYISVVLDLLLSDHL